MYEDEHGIPQTGSILAFWGKPSARRNGQMLD